jgi:sugar phosphate isomerase/epimerase
MKIIESRPIKRIWQMAALMSLILFSNMSFSQVKNEFFPLHNIIRGDSVYNTFDSQVTLIKSSGFDGIEINLIDSFDGMKAALDKHHFKGSYFFFKLSLDEPYIDNRLEGYIARLKNSGTIIAPYIISESKRYKPSSGDADTLVIQLVKKIAAWSQAANLEVALYPHLNYYVESTEHALNLVKKINLKNVGLTFNLCHWLATTTKTERETWKTQLSELHPYLKMITVSGANDVLSTKEKVFDDYILPLGQGTFDTFGLIKYVVNDLKFTGPIGVQCYNIKGNKPALVRNTINVWKTYKTRLNAEKQN